MRIKSLLLISLFLALFLTACSGGNTSGDTSAPPAGAGDGTSESVPTSVENLSGGDTQAVPKEAELLFSMPSDNMYGLGVGWDIFENPHEVGFFVVEVKLEEGGISSLELQTDDGATVDSFGDVESSAVFITDLQIEANGTYKLYAKKVNEIKGEINVYFVPGIGYS